MSVLSVLRPTTVSSLKKCVDVAILNTKNATVTTPGIVQPFRFLTTSLVRRGGGHEKTMVILPSRYQWQKYKDSLHFYIMLGVIPLSMLVFFCNVFIGPATLTEIPCGYKPKHWEYERHPISRFFARYVLPSCQERYERNMFYITGDIECRDMTRLEQRIMDLMAQRGDYPNYYYTKYPISKYVRGRIIEREELEKLRGDF